MVRLYLLLIFKDSLWEISKDTELAIAWSEKIT